MLTRIAPVGLAALLLLAYAVAPRPAAAPPSVPLYRAADAPPQADRAASAPARLPIGQFAPTGPLVADLGFRPAPHGFSFQNYASNFPEEPGTLTVAAARRLFGDGVCAAVLEDGSCIPSPLAEQWLYQMNTFLNSGRCEGLAALSQALFLRRLTPEQLEPGVRRAYDLQRSDPDVSEMVSLYAVTQFLEPVASTTAASRSMTPAEILDALVAGLQPGADPPTLGMYNPNLGGHAVTPFAVEDAGAGLFRVWVYDNNFPGSAKYLEIDRVANTWRYSMAALNPSHDPEPWTGDAQSFSLDLTPASARSGQFVCPFCQPAQPTAPQIRQLVASGGTRMLVVDEEGRRIGYVGDLFVNEIPGAFRLTWKGGTLPADASIYYVPPDLELSVTLTGQREGDEAAGERFAMFAPGSALTFDGLSLKRGQQDYLSVARDGRVRYETSGAERPQVALAVQAADAQYAFTMDGIALESGAALELHPDVLSGRLMISGDGVDSAYELAVARVDATGAKIFAGQQVQLGAGFAQVVAFGDFPGAAIETVALANIP